MVQSEHRDIHSSTGMVARTSGNVSTYLVDFSILISMPPRNPNHDDDEDDEEEDEDGEADSNDDEPAVIREPDE
jgi:hypothetical protein